MDEEETYEGRNMMDEVKHPEQCGLRFDSNAEASLLVLRTS
jgi:hypothetical protein